MRFSIVTATKNAEDSIGATIESVLKQKNNDCEYIFIDSVSTDRTNEIIDGYSDSFSNKGIPVTHIVEKDTGISDGFNKGIRASSGEIIAILNAGDIMREDTLNIVDREFGDNVDVLYGNVIWVDKKHGISYERKSKDVSKLDGLKYTMIVCHPAAYVRREAYTKYGLFDGTFRYTMDNDLMLRMYTGGARFKYIDRALTDFYAGGTSDSDVNAVMEENRRIALRAGEPPVKASIMIFLKKCRHHAAHFARFNPIGRLIWKA